MSGTITELGEGVTGFCIDDRVVIETVIADGSCYGCSLHTPGLCSKRGFIGYSGYGGGFAESICVPSGSVFKLPATIRMDVGALVEPLAVAWHAVKISCIQKTGSALILGGGKYPPTHHKIRFYLTSPVRTHRARYSIMPESLWCLKYSSFRDFTHSILICRRNRGS
jgi:D-arabinose 1-dehydrogenase-like Zn-dependent alcohol dehydrogenase